MPGLIDYAPSSEALLEIEPEDLGSILLRLMHSIHPAQNFTVSHFETPLWNGSAVGYPHNQQTRQSVSRAIAEAWQWLQTEGLIMPAPDQPNGFFCLTRRGTRLKSEENVQAYKKRTMLPRSNLEPVLIEKVLPLFVRGDYELATIQAFKLLEIDVRAASSLPADLVGVELMRAAFHETTGPLTDKTTVVAERKALSHLFAGAFGHGRNPVSHRPVNISPRDAAALIGMASYLLGIVKKRAA